jgi:hypothetical protein
MGFLWLLEHNEINIVFKHPAAVVNHLIYIYIYTHTHTRTRTHSHTQIQPSVVI